MTRFPRVFSPIRIGTLQVKNRLAFAPVSTELGNADGTVSPSMLEYYERRARGGVGLLIVEAAFPDPRGRRLPHHLFIHNDSFIPGLSDLAKCIKGAGAAAILQMAHGGRSSVSAITGYTPVAPSSIPTEVTHVSAQGELPRQLTIDEIHALVQDFAAAAARARDAGFDGVEIHGGHGYLISNFLSPEANLRSDMYGGDIANRARFYREIIEAMRARLGKDYPIIARINCRDYTKGGLEFADSMVAAQLLEKAGADAIHLTGGVHASQPPVMIAPMSLPAGMLVPYAAQLKPHLRVPVITVNRIHNLTFAEEILEKGSADMVAMGRALVADPDLPAKAEKGQVEDIVPCISCNECTTAIWQEHRIGCTVNPAAGQELKMKKKEGARTAKRVTVIGGGVAGMSCAITAARLCHKVTLCEQTSSLGGSLRLAMLPPDRGTLPGLLAYFQRQVEKSNIDVRLSAQLTSAEARALAPDVFVVATGAVPFAPPIPGVNGNNVVQGAEALQHPEKVGKRCVIYGGGMVAVELADLLASKHGVQTMMVVRSDILKKSPATDKEYYQVRLKELGVQVLRNTRVVEIKPRSVVIEPDSGWRQEILDVDTFALATGWEPNNGLASQLSQAGFRTITVGDAVKARKLRDAIREGTLAAFDI
ncbi:MAG: NAD(P)/FAD-dependent oxidoreductase [Dehalococcoidia bacterium]|nr:NAD(P)/FAD-dependent oxidoreductase [Dehalococcoidia bacterium]